MVAFEKATIFVMFIACLYPLYKMEPDYSSSQPRFGYIDVNGGKPRWPHHDKEKVWMVYMVRVSTFWQGPVLEDGRIQCIEIGPCVLDNPTR